MTRRILHRSGRIQHVHFHAQTGRRCHVDQRIEAKQVDLATHQVGDTRLRHAKTKRLDTSARPAGHGRQPGLLRRYRAVVVSRVVDVSHGLIFVVPRCEATAMSPPSRRNRPDAPVSGFRLPPDVRVSRQPAAEGMAYAFRHTQLGELGRLVVTGTPTGETSLVAEVTGDVDDPMTQRRREVLEPLCLALSRALGPGRETPPPPARPGTPVGQVAGEEVHCETCGARVAFLVFAEGAVDVASFEDYARLMYAHYVPRVLLKLLLFGVLFGRVARTCATCRAACGTDARGRKGPAPVLVQARDTGAH